MSSNSSKIRTLTIWLEVVQLFWKSHKSLKKSPACFDATGQKQLLCQNRLEIFSNFVAYSKYLNFAMYIERKKNTSFLLSWDWFVNVKKQSQFQVSILTWKLVQGVLAYRQISFLLFFKKFLNYFCPKNQTNEIKLPKICIRQMAVMK